LTFLSLNKETQMTRTTLTPRSRSPFFQGPIYLRMAEDLHLGGMSERTHAGYLRAVRQLADYCQASPEKITENQLRRYFRYLKNEKKFAYGSLRVAFSGIKFFYTRTCKRAWDTLAKMKLQNATTLPEVLTVQQVHQIVDACTTQRIAVYFWTVYSLGLRMQEGLNLEVGDIDAQRGMVHVHRGKGAKDRCLPLPTSTLLLLRKHWLTHRHPRFLFPAEGRSHNAGPHTQTTMSPTAVQGAMKKITRQINFGKKVSTHTLRHSYATHLLEAGVSLRVIQQYMGHSSLQTTMVYLHLTDSAAADARQTIEKLFQRD
jgi:site-specific recombinase XerD